MDQNQIQTLLNAAPARCKPIVRGESILTRQRGCAIGPANRLLELEGKSRGVEVQPPIVDLENAAPYSTVEP